MIRRAKTSEEVRALLPLARAFTSRPEVVAGLDEEMWVKLWSLRVCDEKAAIFYEEGPDGPIGTIAGMLGHSALDGVMEAQESFWFVDPNHRGNGLMLLDHYEGWARAMGARRLWMMRLDGLRERALDGLYLRRGYRPTERVFCMEVSP